MPVQTSYSANIDAAIEGQDADLGLKSIISKLIEGSDIKFGRAVVRGSDDDGCTLPSATGGKFIGVTAATSAGLVNDDEDTNLYSQYSSGNVMDFGEIWVYTEVAVTPGEDVYFRHTAEASPLDEVGRFRNDSSDGNADKIEGAVWQTTTSAGGIGKIKLGSVAALAGVLGSSIVTITATSGAIPLTAGIVLFDTTAGASTSTLADGVEGQHIISKMIVDGGDQVLTPANLFDGTTITYDDAGDSVELVFANGSWNVVGTPTATVA